MTLIDRLRHPTVGQKLGAAFGIVLLTMLVLGVGLWHQNTLKNALQDLMEHEARITSLADDLGMQVHRVDSALGRALLAEGPQPFLAALKEVDAVLARADASREALVALEQARHAGADGPSLSFSTSDTESRWRGPADPAAPANLRGLELTEGRYRLALDKVVVALKAGQVQAARAAFHDKALRQAQATFLFGLDAYVERERAQTLVARRSTDMVHSVDGLLLLALSIDALVLAGLLGVWALRSLNEQAGVALAAIDPPPHLIEEALFLPTATAPAPRTSPVAEAEGPPQGRAAPRIELPTLTGPMPA